MESQDPLEEIHIETEDDQRPTYVSKLLDQGLWEQIVSVLQEFKDCFAWDYYEMPSLSRDLAEHKLPIQEWRKHVKQSPKRFSPNVMEAIKA